MGSKKIKRAITGVWVILALVITALSPAVSAKANADSPERYRGECGQDGSSVYWSVDPAKNELTISGSGKTKSYFSVHGANQPYSTLQTGRIIEKLVIEEGITEIGASAFESFRSLKSVTLPNSLTKIGGAAFMNCTSLTDITIPDSVIDIEGSVFFGCTAIRNIKLPDKVSNIWVNTFEGCTSLESVKLPDNLKTIEAKAFSGCKAMKDIVIPRGVTDISYSAFDRCGKLTITVDSSNENFCAENGVLYDKNKTKLLLCRGEQSGSLAIPDSVKSIGRKAFFACGNLAEITIPSGVTEIGGAAFEGCESLVNIEIPDTVKTIGGDAFKDCKKLETITLPKMMDTIGEYAFENCESLTSVELPGGIARVNPFLFYHCKNLKDVKISNGTVDICNASFAGCDSLVSLTIPSSLKSVWANVFLDDATLSDIYYEGTQQQWEGIAKNADFKNIAARATVHFECRDKFANTLAEQKTNEKICISLKIGNSELTVNGQSFKMDTSPVITDNTTMLPIRMVAEALGATVEWNDSTQTVIIHDNNTYISIPVLSSVATVNNTKIVDVGVSTFIQNGRTYVPVRFVSEALGADVDWNGETETVTITKQ